MRLHLLLYALFFLILLSPGKVAAGYLGPQFRKLLGGSDKTLESVLQIHKPHRMTIGEEGREIAVNRMHDGITLGFILTL